MLSFVVAGISQQQPCRTNYSQDGADCSIHWYNDTEGYQRLSWRTSSMSIGGLRLAPPVQATPSCCHHRAAGMMGKGLLLDACGSTGVHPPREICQRLSGFGVLSVRKIASYDGLVFVSRESAGWRDFQFNPVGRTVGSKLDYLKPESAPKPRRAVVAFAAAASHT